MHGCTIVKRNDLSLGGALAESYLRHHPGGQFTVVLLDKLGGAQSAAFAPGVALRHAADLIGEQVDLLGAMHVPEVLEWIVLGGVLEALTRETGARVVYLGPTTRVEGPMTELEQALDQDAIVVVPNAVGRLPDDGLKPSHGDLLNLGAVTTSVLGLRAGDAAGALLAGWPTSLDPGPKDNPVHEFRRWFDTIPATHQSVRILREPGYNVAYWNLLGRTVTREDGELRVDGAPLRLLNLADFDPARPELVAPRQERVRLSEQPELRLVCASHAERLLEMGWKEDRERATPYVNLADGSELTPLMRALFRRGVRDRQVSRAPFDDAGLADFQRYLNTPAQRGRAEGLTLLHEAIWDWRDDLKSAYPHLDGPDGAGYAGWLWVYGRGQESIVPGLRPPAPSHIDETDVDVVEANPPWGVNVAGFFTSELGLGEAARLLLAGLDARNIPALPIQGRLLPPCRQGAEFTFVAPGSAPYLINIICMNGDSIPPFAREAGQAFFEGRHSIAMWWWEVGQFPDDWHEAFDYIDEVWVASDHIRDAIIKESPVPVIKVPLPVTMPRIVPYERGSLGLPEEGFLFLYLYDYHSTLARKNPLGLIQAFKRAFAPGSGAKLVMKCINAERLPDDHERVLVAAGDHPDITIIDRYVSADEKNAMIAACDCYVSLHRSEGFGLTPAEAMLLGKPVIATRYGGTLEFTTDENSYLVDWVPVEVGEHAHPYPPQAHWADPDLEEAARLMRRVFEHQDEARKVGRIAAADMRQGHSPAVAGAAMEERLQMVYERLSAERARTPTSRLAAGPMAAAAADLIAADPPVPAGRLRGIKRPLWLVITRLTRPWTRRQRRIDRELLKALSRVDERLVRLDERQRANLAETLSAFRKIRGQLGDSGRGLQAAERRLDDLDARTKHHIAQHEGLPDMAEETEFTVWDSPVAGGVAGLRDGEAKAG